MLFPFMELNDGASNGGTGSPENDPNNGASTDDNNQNPQQSSNNPQYVTVDQLNRAVTGHMKRSEAKIEAVLNEKLSSVNQFLEGLKNQNTNDPADPNKKNTPDPKDAQVLHLQKQLDDMNKALTREREEKEMQQKQAVEAKVKADVIRQLSDFKVDKPDQVYKLVRENLVVDETGTAKVRIFDPTIKIEEDKDLKAGLETWLNLEGSHFLPPKTTGGSGASGSSNRNSTGGKKTFTLDEINRMTPSEAASKAGEIFNSFKEQGLIS